MLKHALAICGLLVFAASSRADILVIGNGAFKPYDAGGDETVLAYWAHGSEGHVGLQVLGMKDPFTTLEQYGTGEAGKGAPSIIKFNAGGSGVTTTLRLEIAGFANSNELYYWDDAGPHKLIFEGSDGPLAVTTFTAVGDFWLDLHSPAGIFHSDSEYYSDDEQQHFAVFKESNGRIWVGVEDLRQENWDQDYNDMIFSMTPVPEPTSLVIFGIGGLLIGAVRLKRRRDGIVPG